MIKANLTTGQGTMTAKGIGEALSGLSGTSVDVKLAVGETTDDGDLEQSCATVPATFKKTR
jgi:hypothetical protein